MARGVEEASPRIGVIGCGVIGRTHLEAYRANGVAPLALADASQAALDAAVATFGGRGYPDYRELLGAGEIEAVSVCTPPSSHREIVTTALEAGIAVLCEKPLATRVEDAEAMARAAELSGTFLTVGFCHRFHPPIERLHGLAESGELGTILMFRNRFAGHMPTVERTWFSRPDVAGGGVVFDTCVHSVDLFRLLVGEPVRVEALVSTTATELGPALAVEDSAIIVLRAATGALGTIEASWRTPPGEWNVTLYGTGGVATVDYGSDQLRVRKADEPDWRVVDVPAGNRFEREIANFLASVRGTALPRVTAADGVAANRIVAAVYASARRAAAASVGHAQ